MSCYRVDFDRIGRNRNIRSLQITTSDPGELAEAVYRHARPHLFSNNIEVLVSLTDMQVRILAGFNRAGTGTIHLIDPEDAA